MPIEISRLFVKANVAASEEKQKRSTESSATPNDGAMNEEIKMQIIDETVKQVMFLLERQKDR